MYCNMKLDFTLGEASPLLLLLLLPLLLSKWAKIHCLISAQYSLKCQLIILLHNVPTMSYEYVV